MRWVILQLYLVVQVGILPKGPCRYMVHTWALEGFPYNGFGVYACIMTVLGPWAVRALAQ